MNIIGTSLNHRTAPIEIRESLHLSKNEIDELIPQLRERYFSEGFILSTCNRTEIFGFPKDEKTDISEVQNFVINYKHVEGLKKTNFANFFSCGAIKHIFSVASGIDSLIIGDSQIHAQVKDSFQIASDHNFAGSILKKVFDSTVKVGKRAITETGIGEGAVSVSYAAIQVIEKIYASFENKSALVIGAGETGELAARHLRDKGIGKLAISNRTLSRAETVAEMLHAEIIPFNSIEDNLHNFDIIVSATSAEGYIISYDQIKNSIKKRRGNPIVVMDIALPRDIDPKVAKIDNVFYHDIDSLKIIVEQNLKKREKEIPKVESIIMDEMVNLFSWYNALEVVPAIKGLRDFFEEIRSEEVEKIKNKVTPEDLKKLDEMTKRLIGRLLHNPTIKLRQLAESGVNYQDVANYTFIIRDLFETAETNKEENA